MSDDKPAHETTYCMDCKLRIGNEDGIVAGSLCYAPSLIHVARRFDPVLGVEVDYTKKWSGRKGCRLPLCREVNTTAHVPCPHYKAKEPPDAK